MAKNQKSDKEYAPSVGFWQAKSNENVFSVFVDAKVFDTIQKTEIGGKLLLSRTKDSLKEKYPKMADFQVSIISKAEVEEYNKSRNEESAAPEEAEAEGL
jgi:hypothetical protein